MKKTLCLALCFMAILSLCACGKTAAEPELSALVSGIDSAIGGEGMTSMDAGYIKGSMKMDVSAYEEYTVKKTSVGTSIDEYGVFKGADAAQAKEIKAAVEAYVQMRLDTWMPEYLPEEFPKLQAAQVWTQGNYVMYAILGDDALTAAKTAFEDSFKA